MCTISSPPCACTTCFAQSETSAGSATLCQNGIVIDEGNQKQENAVDQGISDLAIEAWAGLAPG